MSERTVRLGIDGTLVYYPGRGELYGARAGEQELHPVPIPPELETHWTVEADFIAMIREDKAPAPHNPSFYDGLKCTEFDEACLLSARQGRWVDLPLP